ncbi:TPA: ead/Ea22-like family protein [Klebsiella variicola subsp. variicola]
MTIKNDITELAQSLKAAAEKAGIERWVSNNGEVNTEDYEVEGVTYIDHICNCEIVGTESPRAEFIAMANPANIRALVEALKKTQQRIVELESRTVKLPPKIDRDDADGWFLHKGGRVGGGAAEWYNKALDDVGAELAAAGIQVIEGAQTE